MAGYHQILALMENYQTKETRAKLADALGMKPETLVKLFHTAEELAKRPAEVQARDPHSLLNTLTNAIMQFEAEKRQIELATIINLQNIAIQKSIAEFIALEKEADAARRPLMESNSDEDKEKLKEHEKTLAEFLKQHEALSAQYKEQKANLDNLLNKVSELDATIKNEQKNMLDNQTNLLGSVAENLQTSYDDLNKKYDLDKLPTTYSADDSDKVKILKDIKYTNELAKEFAAIAKTQTDLFRDKAPAEIHKIVFQLELRAASLQMSMQRSESRANMLEEQEKALIARGITKSEQAHLLDGDIQRATAKLDDLNETMERIQKRMEDIYKAADGKDLTFSQVESLKGFNGRLQALSAEQKEAKKELTNLQDLQALAKDDNKRNENKEIVIDQRKSAQSAKESLTSLRGVIKQGHAILTETSTEKDQTLKEADKASKELKQTEEKLEENNNKYAAYNKSAPAYHLHPSQQQSNQQQHSSNQNTANMTYTRKK